MRIPSLDGLRAISIALVVWCHVGDGRGMYSYGSFGVTIFFVISGFLITHLLAAEEEKRGSVSISDFYRRRAFRILPPAILYLLVTAGLTSGVDVLHCLLFVRNLNPGSEVTSHYWSLSIEEQFYLIWPAAFVLVGTNRRRLFVAGLLVAAAPVWRNIAYHLAGGAINVNPARFDLRYDAILAGCCLALLQREIAMNRQVDRLRSIPIVALALVSLPFSVGGIVPPFIAQSLAIMAIVIIVNCVVHINAGPLNYRPVVWLGQLSYSLYLWQQVFCWRSPLGSFNTFPSNLAAALLMACISFYFVERPSLRLRDRLRASRPAPLLNVRAS